MFDMKVNQFFMFLPTIVRIASSFSRFVAIWDLWEVLALCKLWIFRLREFRLSLIDFGLTGTWVLDPRLSLSIGFSDIEFWSLGAIPWSLDSLQPFSLEWETESPTWGAISTVLFLLESLLLVSSIILWRAAREETSSKLSKILGWGTPVTVTGIAGYCWEGSLAWFCNITGTTLRTPIYYLWSGPKWGRSGFSSCILL